MDITSEFIPIESGYQFALDFVKDITIEDTNAKLPIKLCIEKYVLEPIGSSIRNNVMKVLIH